MQRPAADDPKPAFDLPPVPVSSDLTSAGETPPCELNETIGLANGIEPSIPREQPLPTIEGYEILGELGRGGMGVVYRARHILLNRSCALKMILAGDYADTKTVARFLVEAEAVARLQHPNIVQIHHIGNVGGRPYFELEYAEEGSLDRRLDGIPWAPRQAAELMEGLAQGVAEAHRQGIVHRDLKPGNVLLSTDDVPKITDFGLAKSLAGESGLTQTGAIVGTPDYMAPEQAEGKTREVGPLADVYALGAILYELLTGRPPFRGATVLETLEHVRTAEPVPPSRLVPGLPRDAETIALKCLQKEPRKRYDTATALAEDLRRFINGEPIVARPVGSIERAVRWCRRHPAPALLTAAVFLVAALGLMGILWQWDEAVKARDLASRRAIAEMKSRQKAETTLIDMYTTNGLHSGDRKENAQAALWFANAARLADTDPDRQLVNAIRARTWGRLAFSPLHAFVTNGSWPAGLVFHPGGHFLISKTMIDAKANTVNSTLWNMDKEESIPFPSGSQVESTAIWSPDGLLFAVGQPKGDVLLYDFPGGQERARIPFQGHISLLNYSPDGRYLAIAGGNSIMVWDCQNSAFATPALTHPAAVTTISFHPKGSYLATGCRDNSARLFPIPSRDGKPLWTPVPHSQAMHISWYPVFCSPPLFVDEGRSLITCNDKGTLSWRAVETGIEARTVQFPDTSPGIGSIKLSPNGKYLTAVGFQIPGIVLIFEAVTGRQVGLVLEHKNTVFDATFSPDSRTLLTSSSDGTARLWSVPWGEPISSPLDLHRTVQSVAFSPDGQSAATQDSELIRHWTLPQEGLPVRSLPLHPHYSFAALSHDGSLVIPTGSSFEGNRVLKSTQAYRVATGEAVGPLISPGGFIIDAAFSPQGLSFATISARADPTSEGQVVKTWDWASGQMRWQAMLPSEPRSLAYRADGSRLAVLCGGGELIIFNSDTCREIIRWQTHEPERAMHWINNGKLGFSPDGNRLLTWGMGNDVRIWDPETGRPCYQPLQHRDKCHDLQYSPDGQLMALACYDGTVRVHEIATGNVVADLPAHPDRVYSARFSVDGRLLVTACRDRSVRVWDWRVGKLACSTFEHSTEAMTAFFTPDGNWVLSVCEEGTARAWDWRSGKAVTPRLDLGRNTMSLALTPEGKYAVVGGFRTELAVLDLDELRRTDSDPVALCLWAELLAGQQIYEGGGTVNLSAAEWLERWRSFTRHAKAGGKSN